MGSSSVQNTLLPCVQQVLLRYRRAAQLHPLHGPATGRDPPLGAGLLLPHPSWHQAAPPRGAPAPSWSHPRCVFTAPCRSCSPTPLLRSMLFQPRFCPHPKTGTCKPSPAFPAKPWMPAAGPGISRTPCSPFWLLEAFSRRLCIVQKKTPPVAPLGLVLQAAITPTTTLQPLGAGLKDPLKFVGQGPTNLALSH